MRIAELSERGGVPVATIKYYLREGLMQPGTRTGPNQARYDGSHLHRLRLIRALVDVGRLPIATIRGVVEALEDPKVSIHDIIGIAHKALGPDVNLEEPDDVADAKAEVNRFLKSLGWRISRDSPARRELAHALATLRRLGWDVDAQVFDRYAQAADRLAADEVDRTRQNRDRQQTVEAAVVGTVVFESVLSALRRLAHESHSSVRFARR